MDDDASATPPSDHGPDDDTALARLLRAVAAPLRARPDADVRRSHIAAASAVTRDPGLAPRRGSVARGRAGAFRSVLRPVFAGGLALTLVAGLVTAVTVGIPGGLFAGDGGEEFEIAMAPGFTPSPLPVDRTEDHVILTVDAERAEQLSGELTSLLGAEPAVLSVRTDRTAFTVPASVAERVELADVETVADTPIQTLSTSVTQRPVPSWGLDRIDAIDEPLDGSYRFVSTGAGVRVYVVDTGVRADHGDLAGRVVSGWSAIDDGRGSEDCNGHGTHVAGTVAGSSFGVAKDSTIVAVRVLDCTGSGFASSVVSGISWVIANHPGGPGVINLSIGGPANSAIDRAVADATARGLVVVAAAGNNGGDACELSPARAASAVTTGATTSSDARASYSNFGGCVDLFAPGSGITSAWHTSAGASATLSGTSMAAPHVAGIAARLLQVEPGAGPARITSLLTGSATSGTVNDTNGSPNLLANLVDYQEIDCDQLIADGAELPEECLTEEEAPDAGDDADGELDEGAEREGEGRPDSPPGLSGLVPPGFGGPIPGLERAPGLEGRTPPGLVDGVPPGLVRDVPRVNGLSLTRDGAAVRADWRVAGEPDAFVLECTALAAGPTWRTDLALRIAADAVARSADRVSVGLSSDVDALSRCRVAAELDGTFGVRSNAANVPTGSDDGGTGEGGPADAGSGADGVPGGRPDTPGQPAGTARPTVPGAPVIPGAPSTPSVTERPVVPGAPSDAGRPAVPGPPESPGRPAAPEQSGSSAPQQGGTAGTSGPPAQARPNVPGAGGNAGGNAGSDAGGSSNAPGRPPIVGRR